MTRWPWVVRKFTFDFPVGKFPDVLARYRGGPARVDELLREAPPEACLWHDQPETWSIAQNIGHLLDLEPLWDRRLDDYLRGAEVLAPADITNQATNNAPHEHTGANALAAKFRKERHSIVERLEGLSESDWARVAVHPRLKQSLRLVDAICFTSDHDDYHIARMYDLLANWRNSRTN